MKKIDPKFVKLTPQIRLYSLSVPIIGLTGGIATGKSTVTQILKEKGLPIIDADRLVKSVYAEDEVKQFIRKKYPTAWKDGQIHFPALREIFFDDLVAKQTIENLIYQRLPGAFNEAFKIFNSPSFVFYDVPLLFEKGLAFKMDLSVLVYAPRYLQLTRLMARDGHGEELANKILDQQMDIEEKKLKADIVIDNFTGMEKLIGEVDRFLHQVLV